MDRTVLNNWATNLQYGKSAADEALRKAKALEQKRLGEDWKWVKTDNKTYVLKKVDSQ